MLSWNAQVRILLKRRGYTVDGWAIQHGWPHATLHRNVNKGEIPLSRFIALMQSMHCRAIIHNGQVEIENIDD